MNIEREMETWTKVYSVIRGETKGDEVIGEKKSKGRKIKCPCREKHETIKMGKIQRGKEGMSCNRDRRGKRDKEREMGREQRAEEDEM